MASETNLTAIQAAAPAETGGKTVFKILLAISFCHLLNDTVQSLIPAIYPILRTSHLQGAAIVPSGTYSSRQLADEVGLPERITV